MTTPFDPITRQTVSEQIRAQLLTRIESGELAAGSPLPSERSLSDELGVARTSVREAIQGLVSLGVVERRGNRMHVAELLPGVSVDGDRRKRFVRELFETRRVLELPIFELACDRSTDAQRNEIRRVAGEFRPGLPLAEFRRLDRLFHTTLATACGNPLLVELYGKVLDALFRSDEFASLLFDEANRGEVALIVAEASDDHAAIAEAVGAGDPVRTVVAAGEHLDNIEQRILGQLV